MAVTYKSNHLYGAHRARPVYDGRLHSIMGSILIPSGTLLGAADVIRLFRINPYNMTPTRVIVDCSGPLDGHATAGSRTLEARLGYLKSADRAGTNLSFKVSATTTAATEDDDALLAKGTTPIVTTTNADFADTAATSVLTLGGVAVFNNIAASLVRNYDANVMDVAITVDTASSTATTADRYLTVILEFAGTATAQAVPGFLYRYRYNSSGVSS